MTECQIIAVAFGGTIALIIFALAIGGTLYSASKDAERRYRREEEERSR